MTNIKIKKLMLENFKCHNNLVLDFNGKNASIYGDNATGKTSVYDALTWLLFGKDARGNGEKNIEIKPLDLSGTVKDHHAITSVEAVLQVNEDEISLRRTLQEVWSTKRGSTEATYDGNTSEYFIDGVPCKKFAFTAKVDELVSEDLFRMLTSVSYFAGEMPWQDRREVLFRVAGTMSDVQILETREDFAPIIEGMGHLSVDDFKKKLLSEKRGCVGVRDEIPARINECQKTIDALGALDFEAAKDEVKKLTVHKEDLSAQLLAIEHSTAVESKTMEIKEVQLSLNELEAKNRLYRETQTQAQPDIAGMKKKLQGIQNSVIFDENTLSNHISSLNITEFNINKCREDWMNLSNETVSVGCCPTCGQAFPTERIAEITTEFEANKQKKMREIEDEADRLKKNKAHYEEQITLCKEDIESNKKRIAELEAEISSASGMKTDVCDMEGYKDTAEGLRDCISHLQEELYALREDSHAASKELRIKIAEVDAEISEAMAIVGKESALTYAKGRITDLQAEAQAAAEKLQNIERLLFLLEEFTRYKTSFVEDSINGLFRIARFRLFREQANGGIEDRCDVVHEGVPYICVNSGAKINLGIDIINTLSKAYGVSVPLFVDNAESVTDLEKTDSQIIRLVVSEKDKELNVNYEG